MKKSTTPKKLNLRSESVKQLRVGELQNVAGGVTTPNNCPTSTVLPTGDC